jgi:hypothetical protein
MKKSQCIGALWLALLIGGAAPTLHPASLQAQSMADRLKAKAKARADAAADRSMDKGLDHVENAVKCVATDAACIKKAQDEGKPVTVTNAKGQKVSTADSARAVSPAVAKAPPKTSADVINANFDFIPGDKVIFHENFANDKAGDLPEHLDVRDGNFTVVDKGGRKALMTASGGNVAIKLPQMLPERFTIEIEYHLKQTGTPIKLSLNNESTLELGCWHSKAQLKASVGDGQKSSGEDSGTEPDIAICRYMVDKGYAKAYFGGMRTAQLNGLPAARTNVIKFEVPASDKNEPVLLYSVRIASGGQ